MTYDQPGNNGTVSSRACDFNEKLAPRSTRGFSTSNTLNSHASRAFFYTIVENLLPKILNLIYIHQIAAKGFNGDIAHTRSVDSPRDAKMRARISKIKQ